MYDYDAAELFLCFYIYLNIVKIKRRPKGGDFFGAVFIHELIIRLFGYSVLSARARMDAPREGDATIFFNFEWP